MDEKPVQFLRILYSIQSRQITEQYFVYNVMSYKAAWIRLEPFRKDYLGITSVIDVINKMPV